MKQRQTTANLAETIRELYGIVARLERDYSEHKRHFTLDGHLIGSIGEVYAAERYGLELLTSSAKAHDGKSPDGRLVQVKATQRNSVGISERPDYLVVLKIDERGEVSEVYNGPGEPVWQLFEGRKRPKNGQYQVSLTKLATLNDGICKEDRIPAPCEWGVPRESSDCLVKSVCQDGME